MSAITGGVGGASVPSSSDDVFFDANSASSPFEVTIDTNLTYCRAASFLPTQAMTIKATNLYITGSFAHNANVSYQSIAGYFYMLLTQPGDVAFDNKFDGQTADVILSVDGRLVLNSAVKLRSLEVRNMLTNDYEITLSNTTTNSGRGLNFRPAFGGGTVDLGSSIIHIYSNGDALRIPDSLPPTILASSASIYLHNIGSSTDVLKVIGSGVTFGTLNINQENAVGRYAIQGSLTINSLVLGRRTTLIVGQSGQSATTMTFGNITANGTQSETILIRSYSSGQQYVFRKTSGSINVTFVDLMDSVANGGATFTNYRGINSGNNSGWNFTGPIAPTASFTATPTSGPSALTVNFTDTSTGVPTNWVWDFGDGTSSILQNPTKTYVQEGTYNVTMTATNEIGSSTKTELSYISVAQYIISPDGIPSSMSVGTPTVTPGTAFITPDGIPSSVSVGEPTFEVNLWDVGGIASSAAVGTPTITQGAPAPPPPVDYTDLGVDNAKEYVYKVYSKNGTFMRTWPAPTDELEFSQQLLTPGTTTTVRLPRSAENMIESRDLLVTSTGEQIVDSTGEAISVTGTTANTVGPDTDVQEGLLVDIFAFYGGYEELVTSTGESIGDSTGDHLVVATGAPSGKRVFSGKIMKYRAHYGAEEYVEVTLISHGQELTKGEVIKSGSATTVTFATTEIATIARSILNTNPGRIGHSLGSIDTTGVSPTMKFELNTKLEGIKSLYSQTPDGYYWYVDVGENLLYMKKRSLVAEHVFIKGKHLHEIDIEKSAEDLRNKIYFVGGDPGSGTLYKVYEDTAAITDSELGVYRITDRRFTLTPSAQRYAQKVMTEYGRAIWTSTISIPASQYPIEDIRLGQMVGFRNFGNFVDEQLLQVVGFNYTPTRITLNLGTVQERLTDIIGDLDEGLSNEQYQALPTTPS
ncbi:PKD domain-containing protein [Rhodococcus sp. IEGM 1374]|uniref:PKD domain-containing protein n=1 Tax=Rhodococcus sp. IEGM 1374 TaxID=3082221 RepID=UPI0029553CFD|nr:PKD domain-containing protein [Rhodococcus sp. IEGM 1374]MDV7990485.1 PKD domain-containing protein [Rhodococcus sp. IEGM 1374]